MRDTLPTVIARLSLPRCRCDLRRLFERPARLRRQNEGLVVQAGRAIQRGSGCAKYSTMAGIQNRIAAMATIRFLMPGRSICRGDGGSHGRC